MNVKRFTSIMIIRIRLDSMFFIQRHRIGVSREEEGYVYINFAVGKIDLSETKVRNIKIMPILMLGHVARCLFSITSMRMGSG